jgi:hypothetical protein
MKEDLCHLDLVLVKTVIMSQTEHHIGKLRKVVINEGSSVEDWCREKCQELGVPSMLPELYDSWEETLKYHLNLYEKYFFVNGEIWEAFEHIENDGFDDIDIMIPNEDGTITFIQQFYNGGTCLSEVIEEGLEKLKNK